ncbi:hypothetical protein [Xenorhabdus lircayensis]|uniref:Uncharacterized protein n=1 Tax=Xenorhabdus lircayensis TaxID=2763499 RepID=A0ABS0U7T8_9GAMM|nr:hypothetical protein [Xenorhabdus lircayensis]MBI6549940.1 hypothetical protein [Xenorhabdus lircayensis]
MNRTTRKKKSMPRKQLKDFSNSIKAQELRLPPTAKADFDWFIKNSNCRYYLREPFAGEYEDGETPAPYRWYTLVHLIIDQDPVVYISSDGGRSARSAHFIQVGHIPVTCSPIDSDFLTQLLSYQATEKGQTTLEFLWADGLLKMGIVGGGGGVKK